MHEPHMFTIRPTTTNEIIIEPYEDLWNPNKTFVLTDLLINKRHNASDVYFHLCFDEHIKLDIQAIEEHDDFELWDGRIYGYIQSGNMIDDSQFLHFPFRENAKVRIRKVIRLQCFTDMEFYQLFHFIGYFDLATPSEKNLRYYEEIQEQMEDVVQVERQQVDNRGYKIADSGTLRPGKPYHKVGITRDPESEE